MFTIFFKPELGTAQPQLVFLSFDYFEIKVSILVDLKNNADLSSAKLRGKLSSSCLEFVFK